jgi:tripartite-type tricarboxylate transporter receptor subunit TctC
MTQSTPRRIKALLSLPIACAFMAAGAAAGASAQEQDAAAFYKGKELVVFIGTGPGTTYDMYTRMLARHYARHIPGAPTIVPANKPGAGSLNAINALYNTAPRDGTTIGTGHRFIPIMPLLAMAGTQFDANKFEYIGSMGRETTICLSRRDAGFKSIEDVKTRELVVGTTGAGSELTNFVSTLTTTLSLNLKLIRGYQSAAGIDLAIERGELQGRCGASFGSIKATKPEWLSKGFVDILLQIGLTKEPELSNVPLVIDLVKDETDRRAIELMLAPGEIARPYLAPPGTPRTRVEALRRAFDATMKDPELIEDARKLNIEISPMSGEDVQKLITRVYASPDAVVERARKLAGANP